MTPLFLLEQLIASKPKSVSVSSLFMVDSVTECENGGFISLTAPVAQAGRIFIIALDYCKNVRWLSLPATLISVS